MSRKWLIKVQYIYTMENDAALWNDKVMQFTVTWMKLENTMLHKGS